METKLLADLADRLRLHTRTAQLRDNPLKWTIQRRGVHLWSGQRAIMEALNTHQRVAVKSCHGIGKTFTAANAALWWIDTHPLGQAIVVSTAPTWEQVRTILWEEIRKGHRAAGLDGYVNLDAKWRSAAGDLLAFGRKPADENIHGFQGIHRRYVLVIVDEACGVPAQLFTAAEALITNPDSRILAIGNPDQPGTEFERVCSPGSGYEVITISAFETPNFTGEDVPDQVARQLISTEWVDDKRVRWGENSPLWKSKVMGQFPDVNANTLIHPDWIAAAQDRNLAPSMPCVIGVDVARLGTDHTVIGLRRGPVWRIVKTLASSPTTVTAGTVLDVQRRFFAETGITARAHVDTVGVGGGVADQIRETSQAVTDMVAGASPADTSRFLNARAEWYWQLRTAFEAGLVDLDPADRELATQLASLRYEITSAGKIKIESKDDMAKRGVSSPDRADAMMLAFAQPAARPTNMIYGF